MQDVNGSTSLYQELGVYQALKNILYDFSCVYLSIYWSICVTEFGL